MSNPLGRLAVAAIGSFPHAATFFSVIFAAFFLAAPETAYAQIWVSSGFNVTPSSPSTPGGQTETATCSTSAVNPTTNQPSPAAADYRTFLASCAVTPSTGDVITSVQCPGGSNGSVHNYPYGNPTGQCSITFQPQPNVTYTLNSTHALEFNIDPLDTYCGQWLAPSGTCFSDPLGYYLMDPNAADPWPPLPTFPGTLPNSSAPAMNTVNETCSARGGVCAPQNLPYHYCKSGVFGICGNSIFAPEYWDLAQTSQPWQVRCADVLKNSVPTPNPGGGPNIDATFTPNFGFTLAQAEQVCGFINFDWQQTVTSLPLPNPFKAAGSNDFLHAPPSFNDPPPQGYAYQSPPNAVQLPVYYNLFTSGGSLSLDYHQTATTMSFHDAPADPCLPGANPSLISAYCGGNTAPAGSMVAFTTHLVGIQGDLPGASVIDTGIGFNWTSTWNGTTGGAAVTNTNSTADPGSGSGGITVTASSGTTNYQPGTSTPPILLYADQISVTGSGLAYSRVSKLFVGTLTITNDSENTVTGPFQIVLDSLQSNVTLANATGTFGGWPYLTVPNVASLEPGQSASVAVRFSNPTDELLNFYSLVYSGSFN